MSTITIVVVAVWNTLLFSALIVIAVYRKRVYEWIIGADHEIRNRWDLGDNDVWDAFLADHPELSRDDLVTNP